MEDSNGGDGRKDGYDVSRGDFLCVAGMDMAPSDGGLDICVCIFFIHTERDMHRKHRVEAARLGYFFRP